MSPLNGREEMEIMSSGQTVFLFAALMLSSLFMPWVETPFGGKLVPWDTVSTVIDVSSSVGVSPQLSADQIEALVTRAPDFALLLASFPLALLAGVLGIFDKCPRSIAFVSGAVPSGVIIYHVALLIDASAGSSSNMVERSLEPLDFGIAVYIAGGAGLLLTSMMRKDWLEEKSRDSAS